jgi:Uma2 family endonuclease
MSTETFPWHPAAWTLDEVLALPEDQGCRVELIDGALMMSPSPGSVHQRALTRLMIAFHRAVPSGYESLPGVNVVLNERRLLVPDLVVTTVPGLDALYCEGTDVLLAAEIVSPWSRAYDQALKRRLYAEAGVPFLLLVDPAADPTAGACYELDGDEYREFVRSADGVLTLERPFKVTVDLTGQGH